jgi:enamine deaminase RidA (YjgF/YER057c/UK114 family)
MTTTSTAAEDRLAQLGLHLPDAPSPFGAYVPAVQTGSLLFLSGMLATSGHTATVVGVVGKDLDVKAGREAAYTAALNVLALTKKQLGSLNRVSRVVRLGVYVAATAEFTEHPKVADAA